MMKPYKGKSVKHTKFPSTLAYDEMNNEMMKTWEG